jgi:hypothetical protein
MRVPRRVLLACAPDSVLSVMKLLQNGYLQGSQYAMLSHMGFRMRSFSSPFALCASLGAACLPQSHYFRHALCLCRCAVAEFCGWQWKLCNYDDKSVHFYLIPSARASHHGSLRRCIQISSPFYQLYAMTQYTICPNGMTHFNFLRTLHSRDQ